MWSLNFTFLEKIFRVAMALKYAFYWNKCTFFHLWLHNLLKEIRSINLFYKRKCEQQIVIRQFTLLFYSSLKMTANKECLVDWNYKRQSIDKKMMEQNMFNAIRIVTACMLAPSVLTIKMCVNWEPYCSCSWQPFCAFVRCGPKILPPCASRALAKWSRSITEEEATTVI